jgi:anti-sigma-K factor RskA
MINSPNDDLHRLAAAFAVDALDDVERRRFEQHLATCDACTDEVASLRLTVDDLAFAVAEPPPASLKANVLAEVDRTRQVSALTGIGRGRNRTVGRLLSAAAAIVVVGLGGFAFQQRQLATRLEQSAAITEAPDARVVALNGSGSAQLTHSAKVGEGLLVTSGLSLSAAGRTYQVWVVEGATPRSLGTFDVTSGRPSKFRVRTALPKGAVVAVTDEPDGGSPQPTSTPLLASDPV